MIGAVDIGGTKIAVGIVNEKGRVLAREECPSDVARGFEHAMQRAARLLRDCGKRAGEKIEGIGIGSAGPVDPETGRLGNVNNLPGWEDGNPVQFFSREFGVPAALENDADAAALGEVRWGASRAKTRFLYVTVGTGIGVSVILDGRLYRGVAGCHPEIGHHILDPAGPHCTCGARGCWETLAAGPAMGAWYAENAAATNGRKLTGKEICELAKSGDKCARRAVEREGYYLGLGLANLITSFAPESIVLGGSVMKSAPLFLDHARDVIRENCRLVPLESVEIALASLGGDVALIGAAEVWNHRFERTPQGR
ncbi:MAG TPA: ROK family protein [Terriglobales bacterium]|nr:ROK family protein [Terriglobales bacterium]